MTVFRQLCPDKLLRMQEFAGSILIQTFSATVTVMRLTRTADTQGGFMNEYVVVDTWPCSYSRYPVRPVERDTPPRVLLVSEWEFQMPLESEVLPTDRLVVGTRTFEVVDGAVGSDDIIRKVIALEIT